MNNNEDASYLKDSLFCHGVSDLVLLDDDLLLQDLDGVQLIRRFLATHNHLQANLHLLHQGCQNINCTKIEINLCFFCICLHSCATLFKLRNFWNINDHFEEPWCKKIDFLASQIKNWQNLWVFWTWVEKSWFISLKSRQFTVVNTQYAESNIN